MSASPITTDHVAAQGLGYTSNRRVYKCSQCGLPKRTHCKCKRKSKKRRHPVPGNVHASTSVVRDQRVHKKSTTVVADRSVSPARWAAWTLSAPHIIPASEAGAWLPRTRLHVHVANQSTAHDGIELPPLTQRLVNANETLVNCGGSIWCSHWIPGVAPPVTRTVATAPAVGSGVPASALPATAKPRVMAHVALSVHHSPGQVHPLLHPSAGAAAVQVWRMDVRDTGYTMTLVAGLCHDHGLVSDLQWCPGTESVQRVGIVAMAFGNGSVQVLPVPTSPGPSHVHWISVEASNPRVVLHHQDHHFTTLRWHPRQDVLLTGSRTGTVCCWSFQQPQRPNLTHTINVLDGALHGLRWSPAIDHLWMAYGNDMSLCVYDLSDPSSPKFTHNASTWIFAAEWMHYMSLKSGICCADNRGQVENVLRVNATRKTRRILAHEDSSSAVHDLAVCPKYPIVVSCTSSGAVVASQVVNKGHSDVPISVNTVTMPTKGDSNPVVRVELGQAPEGEASLSPLHAVHTVSFVPGVPGLLAFGGASGLLRLHRNLTNFMDVYQSVDA